MARLELYAANIQKTLSEIALYRSGWANAIREGWNSDMKGAQEILFSLYEVSGLIILSLQDALAGRFHDKMAMFLVKQKLEKLVVSNEFRYFDELGKLHVCSIITSGTKHHIRVMLEILEVLSSITRATT